MEGLDGGEVDMLFEGGGASEILIHIMECSILITAQSLLSHFSCMYSCGLDACVEVEG